MVKNFGRKMRLDIVVNPSLEKIMQVDADHEVHVDENICSSKDVMPNDLEILRKKLVG